MLSPAPLRWVLFASLAHVALLGCDPVVEDLDAAPSDTDAGPSDTDAGPAAVCEDPSVCVGDGRTPAAPAAAGAPFAAEYEGNAGTLCSQDATLAAEFAPGNPYRFTLSAGGEVVVTGGSNAFTYAADGQACDQACTDSLGGTHLVLYGQDTPSARVRVSFNEAGEPTVFQFETASSQVLCQLVSLRAG